MISSKVESIILTILEKGIPLAAILGVAFYFNSLGQAPTLQDEFRLTLALSVALCGYMLVSARESWKRRQEFIENISDLRKEIDELNTSSLIGDTFDLSEYYSRITKCIETHIKYEGLSGGGYAISLTSFKKDNPLSDTSPDCRTYHRLIEKCIQRNLGVRRLISVTNSEKWGWVKYMTRKIAINRYELRLYPSIRLESTLSLPLNIQLIGRRDVFIVHSAGQSNSGTFTHIRSKKIYQMFKGYYEDVWLSCEGGELIKGRKVNHGLIESSCPASKEKST